MELNPWYLLYCKRSEQERAKLHLERQGANCYYPQVLIEKIRRGKRSGKLEPLFPNYLFVSFNPEKISFTTVRSTRGVAGFVRVGIEPCQVPLTLIMNLMANEDSDELREKLCDVFKSGELIDVVDGQFAGAEAIYKETDGEYRSILLIKLLNQQVEVSQDNRWIKKK